MRNWRRFRDQAGSNILEKCCHDIDLLNWIVDSLPRYVASFGGLNIFTPENKPIANKIERKYLTNNNVSESEIADPVVRYFATWPAWEDVDPFTSEKDIEDNRICMLEYRNNVRATFHLNSCSGIEQRRMCICGLEGTLQADLRTGIIEYHLLGDFEPKEIKIEKYDMHGGGDPEIINDLVKSMLNNTTPKATGMEALNSALTCLGLDEAMLKMSVIDMEKFCWNQFSL